MSVNYAAGLSEYAHKGKCGQPEYADSKDELEQKIDNLVDLIQHSKHCVVLTGAGISTSTGIPDFRGPKGVWTLEEKGIEPNFTTSFDDAKASFAHMALVALEKYGIVKHLITQNVDGLHLRSGFPRANISILHGDMFIEMCDKCSHQVIKSDCVKSMGLKYTGSSCQQKSKRGYGCRGKMRDSILDWEDALPDEEIERAINNSKKADVYLVLGSSLQIVPAGNLPLHCKKSGGKIITVNLQRTKHHKKTDIVIHSYIDDVMKRLCDRLEVVVSPFIKPSPVLHSIHTNSYSTEISNISIDSSFFPFVTKTEQMSDGALTESKTPADELSPETQMKDVTIAGDDCSGELKRKCNSSFNGEVSGLKKEKNEVT